MGGDPHIKRAANQRQRFHRGERISYQACRSIRLLCKWQQPPKQRRRSAGRVSYRQSLALDPQQRKVSAGGIMGRRQEDTSLWSLGMR